MEHLLFWCGPTLEKNEQGGRPFGQHAKATPGSCVLVEEFISENFKCYQREIVIGLNFISFTQKKEKKKGKKGKGRKRKRKRKDSKYGLGFSFKVGDT